MKGISLNETGVSEQSTGRGLAEGMVQAASNIRIVCESLKRQMRKSAGTESPEAQMCFSALEQSALWLTRAAENQQDVMEANGEELLPAFAMLELGEQFRKALALVREHPTAEGKTLTYTHDLSQSDCVIADPQFADRILLNLVSNALKFGSNVEVRLLKQEKELLLTVQDDGPGIPDEVMEHLFEPYVTDRLPYQQGGGVGLGLALTAKLCRQMDWELRIETGKDGTCVSVDIPKGDAFSARLDSPLSSLAFDAEQEQRVAQELSVLML